MSGSSVPVADSETIELSKAEQRKLDSQHLREPLLTELGNDEVRFSEDAVQLLKFTAAISSITENCARRTKCAAGR